jgi:hypothetical protein
MKFYIVGVLLMMLALFPAPVPDPNNFVGTCNEPSLYINTKGVRDANNAFHLGKAGCTSGDLRHVRNFHEPENYRIHKE